MGYLGNTPTTQSFTSGTDYFNGTGSQTAFTLTRSVNSVNDIQVTVNNVVQQPNDAYTVSGTTLTMTSAPSSGTNNVYVRYLSTTTQTMAPSSGVALSAAIGTASSPSYSFAGDSNTGIFSPAADTIAFAEGGTEVARIDSSGNVGIGTSSPTNKLSLGTTTNGGISLNVASRPHFGATYASDSLVLGYSVKPNPSTVDGMVGTETNSGGGAPAAILMNSGVIQFHTASSITSGAAFSSERMRIDSSGNLLIGKTTYSTSVNGLHYAPNDNGTNIGLLSITGNSTNSGATAYQLYSTSNSTFRFYVNYAGTIFAQSTTITGISDQRLKENIVDLPDGLNAVMALKPRKFDWKEGKGKDIKGDRGFIAQEFETVFPDMIEEWKDPAPEGEEPYKAVNANLIPTLVKAIQELNEKVEAQAAEIAALKGANNAS